MKNYSCLFILLMLTFWPGTAMAEQQCIPAVLPGLDKTKTGLALNGSGVRDIQSVLGPTLVFKDEMTSDVSRMCYTSVFDYSLVAFKIEHRMIIQILVMADKHRYDRWNWCTETLLNADDLTLANGITLGLKPAGLANILGPPRNKARNKWHYVFGLPEPEGLTPLRLQEGRNIQSVSLDMEFTDSRLVYFGIRVNRNSDSTGEKICPGYGK